MPLDITFTLSDSDLDHFQTIVDKAKTAMESDENAVNIEAAARQLITDAQSTDLPAFIADRLSKLEVVIDMVGDDEWQLSDDERRRVLGALIYFCDPEDLIPDHIPGHRISVADGRAWLFRLQSRQLQSPGQTKRAKIRRTQRVQYFNIKKDGQICLSTLLLRLAIPISITFKLLSIKRKRQWKATRMPSTSRLLPAS